jgi:hypothetical protein
MSEGLRGIAPPWAVLRLRAEHGHLAQKRTLLLSV